MFLERFKVDQIIECGMYFPVCYAKHWKSKFQYRRKSQPKKILTRFQNKMLLRPQRTSLLSSLYTELGYRMFQQCNVSCSIHHDKGQTIHNTTHPVPLENEFLMRCAPTKLDRNYPLRVMLMYADKTFWLVAIFHDRF